MSAQLGILFLYIFKVVPAEQIRSPGVLEGGISGSEFA